MISDYCDYNYDDDDVFLAGYKLSPAITCSNKGRKNNVWIIGTVWELKRIIGNFFWEVLERIIGGFLSTLGAGLPLDSATLCKRDTDILFIALPKHSVTLTWALAL